MISERCNCGSEDCSRCYPLSRQACEITDDDRAEALDTIVEEILDNGRFPKTGRAEFDLYEYIVEELDISYAFEMLVATLGTDKFALSNRIEKMYDKVQEMLKKHLADSDMVEEMAQDIADDRGQE